MNKDLKIGDRVTLSAGHAYQGVEHNPIGVKGIVYGITDWVYVNWDNGETNTYRITDSDLIKEN